MSPAAVHRCTVLLVDDESANLDLLEAILEADGFRSLLRTDDARRVPTLLRGCAPDLVLLDLHMPHLNGYELLAEIRAGTAPDDYLPVLVLTADVTDDARERALSGGARDFLTKPFDATEVVLRVRNLLETRLLHRAQRELRAEAECAAARAALLAEATGALASSLDRCTALGRLGDALVPAFADGFAARCADETVARLGVEEGAHRLSAPLLAAEGAGEITLLRGPGRPPFSDAERTVAREIAARAALALENARLLADAEWARRDRERMLSVVAHDLRNPLSAISLYAEMLLSMLPDGADRYTREALQSIDSSTQRMQEMVARMLDAATLQQGVFQIHPEPVPVAQVLGEAGRMLEPLARARGVRLELHSTADGAAQIDLPRVLQVLSNLVGNALRYTPAGGCVRIAAAPQGPRWRFSVADQGPGIEPERVPQIFGAFQRSTSGGTGLGLWIARALVEAHEGRIWVESIPGEGATFHFTVPAGAAAVAHTGAAAAALLA